MSIVLIISSLMVGLAALVAFYHLFLAIVGCFCFRKSTAPRIESSRPSFAIVIPAHNEKANIERTLISCSRLDYPAEQLFLCVVADNYDDNTSAIAKQYGVSVLTRTDPVHRGKGFALEWAFQRLLPAKHDAYMVLDADCELDSDALTVIADAFQAGYDVVQPSYVVSNPDDNSVSYALAIANVLENDFFYVPKSYLGWTVFLRGTGMAMRRNILEQNPWRALSLVEDMEYTYQLIENGVTIRCAPNVAVRSDCPLGYKQLDVQRSRMISGASQISRRHAWNLLCQGICRGRFAFMEAAFTSMVFSRPFILWQLFAAIVVSGIGCLLQPGVWSVTLLSILACVVATYMAYVGLGIIRLGLSLRRLRFCIQIPNVALRYLLLALRARFSPQPSLWHRTPRITSATQSRSSSGTSRSVTYDASRAKKIGITAAPPRLGCFDASCTATEPLIFPFF